MKHAYIFPGQGAQFSGMGKTLYESNDLAKDLFEQANDILGFRISDLMFSGTDADLKQTNVTQPAVFLHSVVAFKTLPAPVPDMVAGHSLGEFSALVANNVLIIKKWVDNIDPESFGFASDNNVGLESPGLPTTRSVGINLNIKF